MFDEFDLILLDDSVETCDHGVPFDEDCEDCDAEDWPIDWPVGANA